MVYLRRTRENSLTGNSIINANPTYLTSKYTGCRIETYDVNVEGNIMEGLEEIYPNCIRIRYEIWDNIGHVGSEIHFYSFTPERGLVAISKNFIKSFF